MASTSVKVLDKAFAQRRSAIDAKFRDRHPAQAREERALRKERASLLDAWSHKREGTPETHAKAAKVQQGALARLFMAGSLSADQLACSQEIRSVFDRIGADVAIGTVSFETRVDQSPRFDGSFFEKLGAVRAEVAYSRWRQALSRDGAIALAMIAEDVGIEEVARRHRIGRRKAKRVLERALDLWSDFIGRACDEVDEATLLAAQAAIL